MPEYMPRAYVENLPSFADSFIGPFFMVSIVVTIAYLGVDILLGGDILGAVILFSIAAVFGFVIYDEMIGNVTNGYSKWSSSPSGKMWFYHISTYIVPFIVAVVVVTVFPDVDGLMNVVGLAIVLAIFTGGHVAMKRRSRYRP